MSDGYFRLDIEKTNI